MTEAPSPEGLSRRRVYGNAACTKNHISADRLRRRKERSKYQIKELMIEKLFLKPKPSVEAVMKQSGAFEIPRMLSISSQES